MTSPIVMERAKVVYEGSNRIAKRRQLSGTLARYLDRPLLHFCQECLQH